ncbi:SMI1/KNR4 family protein [Brevibacillus sp. 179-C9.3 HS]|uniref:SMI1/KNR4 family protein n=1 Tax=unclassified Brevibacillus TaxID=2684853 RepID=UPI0039A0BA22
MVFERIWNRRGGGGVEICGGGLREVPTCVRETDEWRKYGLPKEYVVIQNYGAGVFCLDTSRLKNTECPVIDWEQDNEEGLYEFENFFAFLVEKFSK